MVSRIFASIFLLFIISNLGFSQKINGKIIDSDTKKPLAFVNIRFVDNLNGTTSDIDGRFSVDIKEEKLRLIFSYVGYFDTTIVLNKYSSNFLVVKMIPKIINLTEVEILPQENPAHRIIKRAIENRKFNNPENLKSFSYNSYNKMIFTADQNTSQLNDSLNPDSSQIKTRKFIEKQNIFLMESVSKRYFKKNKNYEEVLGSRVSGLNDPFFGILATQFQSFSFYDPFFNLLGKNYVNPISPASTNKYFFLIQDTIYQQNDSIFIISFRPQKNTNFDALSGLIYINSDGYAVQNVVAEPNEKDSVYGIKIMQMYKKINGQAWFPIQLNTTIKLNTIEIDHMPFLGIGTTYLDSIKINPEIENRVFRKNLKVEINKEAGKKPESYWDLFRVDSLTLREINTYKSIDSIGKVEHLDAKLKSLKILANGSIPLGIISFPLNRFVAFNSYEKFRLGLGIFTNERISRYFNLGIFGAYGTGDKNYKYGVNVIVTPWPNTDFKINLIYKNDIEESAKQQVFGKHSLFSSQNFRNYLVNKMNGIESFRGEVKFRAFKHFVWNIGAEYSNKIGLDDYRFVLKSNEGVEVSANNFSFGEVFLGARFAFREKLIRNQYSQVSMGTKFPILYFQISQASKLLGSDFKYQRLDIQVDKIFRIRYLGNTNLTLKAGYINSSLPWYQLYNGNGSYLKFYVFSEKTYGTMGVNEFLSDKYISLFWEHNFGKLPFKNKYFAPNIKLENNFGWGSMSSKWRHKNLNFNTMEKGFFETGIILANILKSKISSIGFGAFYRYGPYSLPKVKDNFAYKINIGYLF